MKHFIFSSTAAVYGDPENVPVSEDAPTIPMSPYGSSKLMTEIILRDAGAAHDLRHVVATLFQCRGRRSEDAHRTIDAARHAPDQGRGADSASACGRRCRCSAPTIRRRTAPACATTSMSPICARRIPMRSAYLRKGGTSAMLQLRLWPRLLGARGDRHGEARVGRGVRRRDRGRAGRAIRRRSWPAAGRAHRLLRWQPRYDDLPIIVSHALEWEKRAQAIATLKAHPQPIWA